MNNAITELSQANNEQLSALNKERQLSYRKIIFDEVTCYV